MAGTKEDRKVNVVEGKRKGLTWANDGASEKLGMFHFLTSVLATCCFLCTTVLSSILGLCALL